MWRISGRRDPFGRDDPYSGVVKRLRRARITGVDPGAELAATERLKQILLSQIEHPGREPMGTGPTGLLSNDSRGWSEMLNEQKEALDLQALLGGKAPLRVQAGYNASSFPEPQVVRGLRSRNVDMENQTAMAQAQGSRPNEDDILYNWRQKQARAEMEAETEKANLAAIEARMKAAEAENPALAEAKRAASVTDFGMRRGLPTVRGIAPIRPLPSHEPSQVTGVERGTPPTQRGLAVVRPGAMTQLRQQAEIGRDPNFDAAMKVKEAEARLDPRVLAAEAGTARYLNRPMTQGQELQAVNRLQRDYDKIRQPVREMDRQLKLMQSGLAQAKAGNLNAGSQNILVTYQKILDPTSVVRESEYARSPEGQAFVKRIEGIPLRLSKGGPGVTIGELEQFTKAAEAMLESMRSYTIPKRRQLQLTAESFGLDPALIFDDEDIEMPDTGGATDDAYERYLSRGR